jgi:hypothetical protein
MTNWIAALYLHTGGGQSDAAGHVSLVPTLSETRWNDVDELRPFTRPRHDDCICQFFNLASLETHSTPPKSPFSLAQSKTPSAQARLPPSAAPRASGWRRARRGAAAFRRLSATLNSACGSEVHQRRAVTTQRGPTSHPRTNRCRNDGAVPNVRPAPPSLAPRFRKTPPGEAAVMVPNFCLLWVRC